jgi:hypothetical protein
MTLRYTEVQEDISQKDNMFFEALLTDKTFEGILFDPPWVSYNEGGFVIPSTIVSIFTMPFLFYPLYICTKSSKGSLVARILKFLPFGLLFIWVPKIFQAEVVSIMEQNGRGDGFVKHEV